MPHYQNAYSLLLRTMKFQMQRWPHWNNSALMNKYRKTCTFVIVKKKNIALRDRKIINDGILTKGWVCNNSFPLNCLQALSFTLLVLKPQVLSISIKQNGDKKNAFFGKWTGKRMHEFYITVHKTRNDRFNARRWHCFSNGKKLVER